MARLRITACRAELVRQAKKVNGFKSVIAYPFNRINDANFFKDLPGLQLPACLIVFLGRTNTARGQALDQECNWSAVIVTKDAGGDAWEATDELVDDFQDTVLDQQLLDDELTVYASSTVGVAITAAKFAVYEVAFTTREAVER